MRLFSVLITNGVSIRVYGNTQLGCLPASTVQCDGGFAQNRKVEYGVLAPQHPTKPTDTAVSLRVGISVSDGMRVVE